MADSSYTDVYYSNTLGGPVLGVAENGVKERSWDVQ